MRYPRKQFRSSYIQSSFGNIRNILLSPNVTASIYVVLVYLRAMHMFKEQDVQIFDESRKKCLGRKLLLRGR